MNKLIIISVIGISSMLLSTTLLAKDGAKQGAGYGYGYPVPGAKSIAPKKSIKKLPANTKNLQPGYGYKLPKGSKPIDPKMGSGYGRPYGDPLKSR